MTDRDSGRGQVSLVLESVTRFGAAKPRRAANMTFPRPPPEKCQSFARWRSFLGPNVDTPFDQQP
ncbi:hypothetical protein A8M32_02720 [Sinorhizobium alkalisoli]|uniref:Uncharacterized protein n=1 Tax=Sinorhizobium alkalisoli TaxID=1752398 RepID=A0A1E3VIP1_9HYPH|nr:hypothetical protein A8M32_02720 [Sinorhizobium alkalisoli]